MDFLYAELAGNTILDWGVALGLALLAGLAIRFLKALAVRRAARRSDDEVSESAASAVVDALGATRWFFYLAAGLYAGSLYLALSPTVKTVVAAGFTVVALFQAGLWLQVLVKALVNRWGAQQGTKQSATMAAGIVFVGNLTIWSAVALLVLANVGVEISALIAGLGVGGVAVALAVQGTLADLFASLSMYFDRPFDIGDFIIVGDYLGTVDRIGLRTTRIKGLGGEQIVFSNGDLVKSRVRNYARMKERRVVFSFGIEYNLPAEKVERAASIAREVIEQIPDTRFDRVHFKQYGAYSLDFEAVYYVLVPDYNVYMQKQHEINLGLYRRFETEGIPFAFPTRTLHLRGGAEVAQDAIGALGRTEARKGNGNGSGPRPQASS